MTAASLLFIPGTRPDGQAVRALARRDLGFSVSFDPMRDGAALAERGPDHWLELLAGGMTFDLAGLAPGAAAETPPARHAYGLAEDVAQSGLEALTLRPGAHLAGGLRMMPVVRSLAWLTALLTDLPGVQAVVWHPARCWSAPESFSASVLRWVEGGVFPGFSLAALSETPDRALLSEGLALFTGQELRLEPGLAEDRAEGAKIALRLLHWLAQNGTLTAAQTVPGPDGELLRLEPSADRRLVQVSKDSRTGGA
ncbi:MAG: hypothetical protein ABIP41_09740 [Croceibacterium sp.]